MEKRKLFVINMVHFIIKWLQKGKKKGIESDITVA
jgi:hypothetical protein